MKEVERSYWLAFSVFPGIGPKRFSDLIAHFGSAEKAWQAPRPRLGRRIGEKLADKFEKFRLRFSLDNYKRILLAEGVSFLTLNDKNYPSLLKQIENPPFVLYIKGDPAILRASVSESRSNSSRLRDAPHGASLRSNNIIAIVGTRRVTSYGREVTELFTQQLVNTGFTIVSGLAMGVDAIAHKTTIDNGGKTIAVLGNGVDICYPTSNKWLYDSLIKENGCIVSEYPIGQQPTKGSFPSRNRIIAGLSQAVLVTEGAEDSGALITAKFALELGRKVFAVPGPITSSLSKGPYKLIQKGAKLVTNADDILKEFKVQSFGLAQEKITTQKSKVEDATKEELEILKLLENETLQFDEIVRKSGFGSAKVGMLLSMLEMKGSLIVDNVGLYKISS
ncbi:MAG: DNA-protecting protein DprA [Candidatus Levybacteria bacterium]|nr:DNA-protecting protein DprA [Candidatus Levybacteria bacterium]